MILKKFLKFGKSSLGDSYKKDSYKKKVCMDIYFSSVLFIARAHRASVINETREK